MKDVRSNVNGYLDRTRPKRQKVTENIAFFIIMLFAAYIFGRMDRAEEIRKNGIQPDPVSASSQQGTQNKSTQGNCSLPEIFPAQEYQDSWENTLRFCEEIESSSAKWGFEPELIATLIMLESGGDPSAISQSGAIGLMQIMSSDGLSRQLYGDYFSSRPTVLDLLDPGYNIEWGTSHLASLINIYGSLREALFHYGPMDVGYEEYADMVLSVYSQIND
jgi:hypothetical protein